MKKVNGRAANGAKKPIKKIASHQTIPTLKFAMTAMSNQYKPPPFPSNPSRPQRIDVNKIQ